MRVIAQDPRRVVVTNAMLKPGEKSNPANIPKAMMIPPTPQPAASTPAAGAVPDTAPDAAPDTAVSASTSSQKE